MRERASADDRAIGRRSVRCTDRSAGNRADTCLHSRRDRARSDSLRLASHPDPERSGDRAADARHGHSARDRGPDPVPAPSNAAGQAVFGRIRTIDVAGQAVKVDLAEMLTGDAAVAAAVADGAIKRGEMLDTDYYIHPLGMTATYSVDGDTQIVILVPAASGSPAGQPATLVKLANLVKAGPTSTAWYPSEYWRINVLGGHATSIQAQYLP